MKHSYLKKVCSLDVTLDLKKKKKKKKKKKAHVE